MLNRSLQYVGYLRICQRIQLSDLSVYLTANGHLKKLIKFFGLTAIVLSSSFLLSACGKKSTTTSNTPTPTQASKQIELSADEKPTISLVPRVDGHNLAIKITGIPSKFTSVDYELVYTAKDQNLEIEKGVSGTLKPSNSTLEKDDLLLGTASCTNGCKYKYDEGVTGGTLTLTFTTDNKEYATYETPFTLKSATDLNKDKKLSIDEDNFVINGTVTSKSDYFIAIKNA